MIDDDVTSLSFKLISTWLNMECKNRLTGPISSDVVQSVPSGLVILATMWRYVSLKSTYSSPLPLIRNSTGPLFSDTELNGKYSTHFESSMLNMSERNAEQVQLRLCTLARFWVYQRHTYSSVTGHEMKQTSRHLLTKYITPFAFPYHYTSAAARFFIRGFLGFFSGST